MPFANLFPSLPLPLLDIIMYVVATLGVILLTYGVFLEAERKQDAVFIIASGCLLVYALWINSLIFSLAMAGLFVGRPGVCASARFCRGGQLFGRDGRMH